MDKVPDGTYSLGKEWAVRRESLNACKATYSSPSELCGPSPSLIYSSVPGTLPTQRALLHKHSPSLFSPYQKPSCSDPPSPSESSVFPFLASFPKVIPPWALFSMPIPGCQQPLGTCLCVHLIHSSLQAQPELNSHLH